MTRQQVVVVIAAALLVAILSGLAIHQAWVDRHQPDEDETWKDDYTGWGG
jgi:hypothetical protein